MRFVTRCGVVQEFISHSGMKKTDLNEVTEPSWARPNVHLNQDSSYEFFLSQTGNLQPTLIVP